MLSGLCQILHSWCVPIEWPSLSKLYEEERRCATLICMTVDFIESMQPYGIAPIIPSLRIAWGAYWRQKDSPLGTNARAFANWLKRRGNKMMALINVRGQMSDITLEYFNARLMGGQIVPITANAVRHLMHEQKDIDSVNKSIRAKDETQEKEAL